MNTRFEDTQYSEFSFGLDPEYLVRCPKCESSGIVRRSIGFRCSSCSLTVTSEDNHWYSSVRGFAGKRCSKCGRKLSRRFDSHNGHDSTEITCEGCDTINECKISWSRIPEYGTDPVFGCDLLLRCDYRGEVLWAWNLEHLEFLENYVGSGLRERIPNRNGSMASRLPKWMKEAKNRDGIMRAFSRLREHMPTY